MRFRKLSVFLIAEKSMRNDPEHNLMDFEHAVSIFIDMSSLLRVRVDAGLLYAR